MSLYLMGRVFHTPIKNPIDKLVLLALAEHAWDDGTQIKPSQARLRAYTGVSNGTINSSIARLVKDRRIAPSDGMPYPFGKAGLIRIFKIDVSKLGEPIAVPFEDKLDTSPADGEVPSKNPTTSPADGDPTSPADGDRSSTAVESESKPCASTQRSAHSMANGAGSRSTTPKTHRLGDFLPTPTLQARDKVVHPIRYILTRFDLGFLAKIGDRHPTFSGKDAKLAERMLKQFSVDRIAQMVDVFFKQVDEWTLDKGYGFNIFYSQWPKLVMKTSKTKIESDPYAHFPKL